MLITNALRGVLYKTFGAFFIPQYSYFESILHFYSTFTGLNRFSCKPYPKLFGFLGNQGTSKQPRRDPLAFLLLPGLALDT